MSACLPWLICFEMVYKAAPELDVSGRVSPPQSLAVAIALNT